MDKSEEILTILKGIETLKKELYNSNITTESLEIYKRIDNLHECLTKVCWQVYGQRKIDKSRSHIWGK